MYPVLPPGYAPALKYKSSAPCDAGSRMTEQGCVQCRADTYSGSGAEECINCPERKISAAGSVDLTDCYFCKFIKS